MSYSWRKVLLSLLLENMSELISSELESSYELWSMGRLKKLLKPKGLMVELCVDIYDDRYV